MEYWTGRQLGFSEILNLTFSLIKKHFIKLFLLALILTGPFYIAIAAIYGDFSLYGITIGSIDLSGGIFNIGFIGMDLTNITSVQKNILIAAIVLLELFMIPLAIASIILSVGAIIENKKIGFGHIVFKALTRYWAIFRGNVSYFFFIVLILFFLGVLPITIGINEKISFIYLLIAILSLLVVPTVIYLMTMMSLYYAVIVFEKGVMGIRKSWELVKGQFPRLLGLYIVVIIMDIVVFKAFQFGFETFFGHGITTALLNKLVFILLMIINVVYYTVIYYDFKAREEVTISQ